MPFLANPTFWLRLCVSAALLFWAFSQIDFAELRVALTPALAGATSAAAILIAAGAWLQARRWRDVAAALGTMLPAAAARDATLISYFLTTVTPSIIVADAVRLALARRAGARWAVAAHSVLVDRAFGFLALIALGALSAILIVARAPALLLHLGLPLGVLAAGAAAGLYLLRLNLSRHVLRRPICLRWARLVHGLRRTFGATAVLIRGFALSLAIMALSITAFGVIAATANAPADPATLLILVPSMLLLSFLPISVNGWGVREASAVAIFPLLGASEGQAVATSVAFGLSVMGAGALCLLAWLALRGR